jgi:DUF4097 and DUF4098 domain-containing protein YvlB
MRTVTCWSASIIVLLAAGASCRASDKSFDRELAVQPRGVVDISNVSGSITVTGWDRAEVSVHADLDEGVERVEVNNEASRTSIKVILPHHNHMFHGSEARLEVKIPKESELVVSAVSADVKTSGVLGVQRLNAVSGDIVAEIAGSDVVMKSVSGDIKLKGHGQTAHIRASTVSGDLHIEHGAGDLEATTVSGTITATLDIAASVRVRSTSGDVNFNGRLKHGAEFEAVSVSGEVNARASSEAGYNYEVSSFSGDIRNCFDAPSERTSKYGPGHLLQGSRGEGSGHVHIKTMSGDVQLCDRN